MSSNLNLSLAPSTTQIVQHRTDKYSTNTNTNTNKMKHKCGHDTIQTQTEHKCGQKTTQTQTEQNTNVAQMRT